jgi:hypothetical protein
MELPDSTLIGCWKGGIFHRQCGFSKTGPSLPIFDPLFLSKFPDLTPKEFSRLIELSFKTQEKMERERLAVTAREDWPQHCETRLQRDIQAPKKLIQ